MATVVELPEKAQVAAIAATNTDTNEKVAELVKITKDIASGIGAYVTLVVTLVSRDGATITGQTVTAVWTAAGQGTFTETKQYNGEAITFAMPKNSAYVITASDTFTTRQDGLYDHFAPSVATGMALIDTAVTLTYLDAGDSTDGEHVSNIHSITELKRAVDAIKGQYKTGTPPVPDATAIIAAGCEFLVGVEVPDTWIGDDGTTPYDDPLIVAGFGEQTDEDGNTFIGATLMRKWATVDSVMFDNRNQEMATEETAQEGVYYYGLGAPYSTSAKYDKNSVVSYEGHLYLNTTAVPAGGETWTAAHWSDLGTLTDSKVPAYDATATYTTGRLCHHTDAVRGFTGIYKCTTAIELAEEWNPAHWILQAFDVSEGSLVKISVQTGDSLAGNGYAAILRTSLNAGGSYVQNAIRYGHNNWGASAYRQYLNSSAARGEWWEQKHAGQIAPFNPGASNNPRGYMAGCSAELLGVVRKVKIRTWANNNTDSAQGKYLTTDTFFLPSGSQMVGEANLDGTSVVEGKPFQWMVDYICEELASAGCTVQKYASRSARPVSGESGIAYFEEDTGMFFCWRDDTNAWLAATNDDRDWTYNNYMSREMAHYETRSEFPATGDTSHMYYDNSNDTVWMWDTNKYTDKSTSYYIYIATKGRIASARRRFNRSRSAVHARLRSAYRGYSGYAWFVYATGYLSSGNAAVYAYVGVPACVI